MKTSLFSLAEFLNNSATNSTSSCSPFLFLNFLFCFIYKSFSNMNDQIRFSKSISELYFSLKEFTTDSDPDNELLGDCSLLPLYLSWFKPIPKVLLFSTIAWRIKIFLLHSYTLNFNSRPRFVIFYESSFLISSFSTFAGCAEAGSSPSLES